MDERKEKLIAYLSKNLQIAETTVAEFDKIKEEIQKLEDELSKKKVELEELGDLETAIANVDEIRGFIEDLTKPEEIPEDKPEVTDDTSAEDAVEVNEECEACAIPSDEQLNTTPVGGATFF